MLKMRKTLGIYLHVVCSVSEDTAASKVPVVVNDMKFDSNKHVFNKSDFKNNQKSLAYGSLWYNKYQATQ